MRLITFEHEGGQIPALLNKSGTHAADINTLGLSKSFRDIDDLIATATTADMAALRGFAAGDSFPRGDIYDFSKLKLLAPIVRPRHDIICLGLNYSEHIAETGSATPEAPVYFGKRAAKTSGHKMVVNGHIDIDACLDYEVELALIIGKEGTNIAQSDVEDYIFGYTVLNDFSARTLQSERTQWFLGKGADGFASMGPWIVTKDELPFPLELALQSRVNGEIRQNSNTKSFINHIASIIADISRTITLEPGDIVSTGTPSGVGKGFNPPKYLRKGDVVECEVQGIGILENTIG